MFFSIVVPVYNAKEYIKKAVESVLRQSFQDYELILVDDGSTDGSADIIDSYEQIDRHIKAIHKENGGVSSARNCGIDCAQGEYLLFMDADDIYKENALSILFRRLENREVDFLCFGYEEITVNPQKGNKRQIHNWNAKSFEDVPAIMQSGIEIIRHPMFGAVWSKAYRLEIIRDNLLHMDEKLFLGEDYCFNLMMLKYCNNFYLTQEPLYCYMVQNENSLIQRYNKNKFSQMYRMHIFRTKFVQNCDFGNENQRAADIRYNFVRICMSAFMDLSRRECPFHFREQLNFINQKKRVEKESFHFRYLSQYSMGRKVAYIIFSIQNNLLIWGFAKTAYFLKFRMGRRI